MSDNAASALHLMKLKLERGCSKTIWFRNSLGADSPERTVSVYRQVKGEI
jgi:hypothetical protein